ncbi:hypothetical protein E2C01_015551 [Portunus trituberculatus]|uniref:Uncharacterized protein n=1 Tax=Portunus trituberculatus TaxID=210409 RepID=A0A5B7DND4_PORTR|nr:hypothetical protein [Portunus trituberculatus]
MSSSSDDAEAVVALLLAFRKSQQKRKCLWIRPRLLVVVRGQQSLLPLLKELWRLGLLGPLKFHHVGAYIFIIIDAQLLSYPHYSYAAVLVMEI